MCKILKSEKGEWLALTTLSIVSLFELGSLKKFHHHQIRNKASMTGSEEVLFDFWEDWV